MLEKIVRPDVIETGQVVLMRMGKDHGIEPPNIRAQHLPSKIWCGVHNDRGGCRSDEDTGTKPFVFGIDRSAYGARTCDHRNASACARTQERDL